jgi:hypothetical protein
MNKKKEADATSGSMQSIALRLYRPGFEGGARQIASSTVQPSAWHYHRKLQGRRHLRGSKRVICSGSNLLSRFHGLVCKVRNPAIALDSRAKTILESYRRYAQHRCQMSVLTRFLYRP